jgi:hypothetical protein
MESRRVHRTVIMQLRMADAKTRDSAKPWRSGARGDNRELDGCQLSTAFTSGSSDRWPLYVSRIASRLDARSTPSVS